MRSLATALLAGLTALFVSPEGSARASECSGTVSPVSIPELPLRMTTEREGDTLVASYMLGLGHPAGVHGLVKTLEVHLQRRVVTIKAPDGWQAHVESDGHSYSAVWTWETPRADGPAEVTGFQAVVEASGPTYWTYSVGFTDGSVILAGAELKGSCSP